MKKILITGSSGFIGFHLCLNLLSNKYLIYGIDNLLYDSNLNLKKKRTEILKKNKYFKFYKIDLANKKKINELIKQNKIKYVIHLAAIAGVRGSFKNPQNYFNSNVDGFFNILEICKINKIDHFIFASTSSVYGDTKTFPSNENDNTDKPISFYAATKKSNEIMAYSYSAMYKLPCTTVRFFTVYGPYGRSDMALYKFTKNIDNSKNINVFNYGKHNRDFTYIDDIINGLISLIDKPLKNKIPFNVLNIGSGKSENLLKYITEIENGLGKTAKKVFFPIQPGDSKKTQADITKIKKYVNFKPKTKINKGVKIFIDWYKNFKKY